MMDASHGAEHAVFRVLSTVASATAATGAFPGPVSVDPGNLLVCDTVGPTPDALQVTRARLRTTKRCFRRLTTPLCRSSPALLFQADATAACLSHGRDVLQRLLVRLLHARFLDRHRRRLTPTPLDSLPLRPCVPPRRHCLLAA
jgi:hypothetical protein